MSSSNSETEIIVVGQRILLHSATKYKSGYLCKKRMESGFSYIIPYSRG